MHCCGFEHLLVKWCNSILRRNDSTLWGPGVYADRVVMSQTPGKILSSDYSTFKKSDLKHLFILLSCTERRNRMKRAYHFLEKIKVLLSPLSFSKKITPLCFTTLNCKSH